MLPEDIKNNPLYTIKTAYRKLSLMNMILKSPVIAYFIFRFILKSSVLNKESWFNRAVRFSVLMLGGGRSSIGELKATKINFVEKKEGLGDLLEALKKDKPVVWVEWSVSRIVLKGFDVASLCPENFPRMASSINKELAHLFLDEAEKEGILSEGCSSQKSAMGALLLNQIPAPVSIIATSLPCDSGISVYQNMQYKTGAPLFVLDAPYDRSEKSVEFYGEQYMELIKFLEEHLGQTFNWEKFREALEEYNNFSSYLYETSEMGKNVPCPYHITSLHEAWELRSQYAGSARATDVMENVYKTARNRMKKGKGIVKNEKIRVLWWDVPLAFTSVYPWMEEKYGAVTVTNFLTKYPEHTIDTSDRKKMLEGAALIDLYNGMSRQAHGKLDLITDELYEAVDAYSPDCIMFIRHAGCRHGWAVSRIIRDTCKKIGLPALYMSADIFDDRVCTEYEIKSQIDSFLKSNGLV